MTMTMISKFLRKFSAFQEHACCEPVEITRHGQRAFVLISAEHHDWMRAAARRTYRTSGALTVVIDAMERAEMDSEHTARDKLLK
jgi:PHD/YefM family antitoxin component YafN of YafNO toxin-antitoxin module